MIKPCNNLRAVLVCAAVVFSGMSQAQTPAPRRARGGRTAAGPAAPPVANLAQLMRGIFFPSSNVIFASQNTNPADVKPEKDPSTALNPLASAYGQWTAVENAALAIAEASRLLMVPGRKCANGVAVPLNDPDWPKFVEGVREAGIKAYEAAQSKNQDKMLDASDVITTACANCHDKWREKPNLQDRCK